MTYSGGPASSVWRVELNNFGPSKDGVFPLLVAVEPAPAVTYSDMAGDHAPADPVAAYDVVFIDSISQGPSAGYVEFTIRAFPTAVEPDVPVNFDVTVAGWWFEEVQWFWDLDDIPDLITPPNQNQVDIAWQDVGAFDLEAMVTGDDGWGDLWHDPIPITISEDCVPPVAGSWPDFPWTLKVGKSLTFDAATTQGTAPMTFDWDWGDGNGYSETSSELLVEHTFNDLGVFNVMVRANNACGNDELDEPVIITVKEF
jgi:hypothetical protein